MEEYHISQHIDGLLFLLGRRIKLNEKKIVSKYYSNCYADSINEVNLFLTVS